MGKKMVYGGLIAVTVAAFALGNQIGGVEVWKWLLAAIGLAIFIANGRGRG